MNIFKRPDYSNVSINLPIKGIRLPEKEYIFELGTFRPNADVYADPIYRQVNIEQNQTYTIEATNLGSNTNVTHGADIALTLIIKNPNGSTYNKVINFGDAKGLTIDEYMQAFSIVLNQGNYRTGPQQQNIKNEITFMINEHNFINYGFNKVFIDLVDKLPIPTNWMQLGLNQVVDRNTIANNKVDIILFGIKNKISGNVILDVLNLPPKTYLDGVTGQLISKQEAKEMASDGFLVDNVSATTEAQDVPINIPTGQRPLLLEEQTPPIFMPMPKNIEKITALEETAIKRYLKLNAQLKAAQLKFDNDSGVSVQSKYSRNQPDITEFYKQNGRAPKVEDIGLEPVEPQTGVTKYNQKYGIWKRAKTNWDSKYKKVVEQQVKYDLWKQEYDDFVNDYEQWKVGQGLRGKKEKAAKHVKRAKIVKNDIKKQSDSNNLTKLFKMIKVKL